MGTAARPFRTPPRLAEAVLFRPGVPGASRPLADESLFPTSRQLLEQVFALEGAGQRLALSRVHEPHRPAPGGVFRTATAVVHADTRLGVARVTGIERPVRATDDVDEVEQRH